jgi:DNA-binding protein H-NS
MVKSNGAKRKLGTMDLSKMSLEELRELDAQISVEIVEGEKRRRADAIQQIQAVAESLGVPLKTLLAPKAKVKGERQPGQRAKTQAYRDPANPSNVWAGAGPRPAWMKAALSAGVPIDQLRAD